ncbi:MAG: altronate dehydratase family protein [Candidatus Sulfotelmatobacter sp.]|jgi:altronate hydrolase|nr:altronate dehydratase family protein [Terriglobales bacterium]
MQNRALKIDPKDNVLIALTDLHRGERITYSDQVYILRSEVPAKHKFSTDDLSADDEVMMYGVLVGKARERIQAGEVLTTRNVRHEASRYSESSGRYEWNPPDVSRWRQRTFLGYHRPDGQVGTRNYWLVVPLVFCENRNIAVLKQAFLEELGFAQPNIYRQQVAELIRLYAEGKTKAIETHALEPRSYSPTRPKVFGNVDGIKFLMHEGGCGGTREDANNLCGLLAGYIHHPNVAGATVLSLGCQNSQIDILQEQIARRDPHFSKPMFVFEQQQSGSELKMLSEAVRSTFMGLAEANESQRAPTSLSRLCVGLKCGGSDGFSGISANPAVGRISDTLAALGARSLLSEFPELCGVEQQLIDRCIGKAAADRFMQLMRDYASRAKAVGSGFDMNPSPGNIRDGLVTDAMKSAGAARKGGTSPVTAVLDYPDYSTVPGLNLQCTPGNDVECVTAQVGAGANLILFTTGLGTPTGNPIAPVLKISTNSPLAQRMEDIIDFDAGAVISGESTIEEMGDALLERVVEVASGQARTKAELLGQDDFIPWKRGVSL